LIKRYHLDGLDIDIEEHIPLSSAHRLLRRLHIDLGPNFILTMAPLATALGSEDGDNVSGFSYSALERIAVVPSPQDGPQNSTSIISWYNAQFYSGYARSSLLYKTITERGFAPGRLVLGVTTSEAGYPNGFTPLKKLTAVIRELKEMYGEDFGGVSAWEYWDAGSQDKDMGMRIGGEPWRWVQRIAKAVFGDEEVERRGRGLKGVKRSRECWRQCARGGI
jgi:chitinase